MQCLVVGQADRRTGICSFSKEERPTDLSRHKDSAGVATNNKTRKEKRARIPPFRCVAFALPRLARLRWSGFIDHRYKLSRLYLLFAFSSGPSHGSFMGPQNDREEKKKKNKWREHEKNFSCLIPEFFFSSLGSTWRVGSRPTTWNMRLRVHPYCQSRKYQVSHFCGALVSTSREEESGAGRCWGVWRERDTEGGREREYCRGAAADGNVGWLAGPATPSFPSSHCPTELGRSCRGQHDMRSGTTIQP